MTDQSVFMKDAEAETLNETSNLRPIHCLSLLDLKPYSLKNKIKLTLTVLFKCDVGADIGYEIICYRSATAGWEMVSIQ